MAVSMGIKVQPSRFAALQVDSGPDSGGEEGGKEEWKKVPKGGGKGKGMKHGPASGGGGGDGGMSKSAKKRARKKKNHLSASSEVQTAAITLSHLVMSCDHPLLKGSNSYNVS